MIHITARFKALITLNWINSGTGLCRAQHYISMCQVSLVLNENHIKTFLPSILLSLTASTNSAREAIFVQMWNSMKKTDSCRNINQNVGCSDRSQRWGRVKGHRLRKKPSSGWALISLWWKSWKGTPSCISLPSLIFLPPSLASQAELLSRKLYDGARREGPVPIIRLTFC